MYASKTICELTKIPVCESPLTPDSKIIYLSPEEYKSKFGCDYSESLELPSDISSAKFPSKQMPSDIKQEQVLDRMAHPLDSLVICKLADPIGYSIMTSKAIPRNTVIGFFHGAIKNLESSRGLFLNYGLEFSDRLTIDPEKSGSILRFMAHLPFNRKQQIAQFKAELKEGFAVKNGVDLNTVEGEKLLAEKGIDFDKFVESFFNKKHDDFSDLIFQNDSLGKQIATANVAFTYFDINGQVLNVVYTITDIPAFSMVGFSYGQMYFSHPDSPSLRQVFPNGELLKQELCYWTAKQKPEKIYADAVDLYRKHNYSLALKLLEHVSNIFSEHDNKFSMGACYSTMASCFREQKQIIEAVNYCIKACGIFSELSKEDKYDFNQKKLLSCLERIKDGTGAHKTLYTMAINLYKKRQYNLALILLEPILAKFSGKEQAVCLSTMASCARGVGELEAAEDYCRRGLTVSLEALGDSNATTVKIKKKLQDILDKKIALEPKVEKPST